MLQGEERQVDVSSDSEKISNSAVQGVPGRFVMHMLCGTYR